jgi:hypothetical protein
MLKSLLMLAQIDVTKEFAERTRAICTGNGRVENLYILYYFVILYLVAFFISGQTVRPFARVMRGLVLHGYLLGKSGGSQFNVAFRSLGSVTTHYALASTDLRITKPFAARIMARQGRECNI